MADVPPFRRSRPLRLLVTGVSSDAHTWNLVYLQALLEEMGHEVVNLGACVPDELLVRTCRAVGPDAVVMSSVNGHGWRDGARAVRALHEAPGLAATPAVIGGKLSIDGPHGPDLCSSLLAAGFDEVFEDCDPRTALAGYLATVRPGVTV
ncbi:cobalamin B12-binding domain-containing protein [Streptomyces sp. NPDC090306]|uniref:cobalamin B12-binding domain-containing protein n=1 Tax=unclassified Streptomyces TaxID=2593676 RepID=UPI0036E8A249